MENVEREKIQKDLLNNIKSFNCLFRGGTALRLVYGLNRYSEDIDFTNGTRSEAERIYYQAKMFAKSRSYNYTDFHSYEGNGAYFYIIKPKEYNGKIKIEISYEKTSNNVGYNIYQENKNIKVMSIEEILSEKMRTIIERKEPAPRDLFDMRFIYKNYHDDVFELDPSFWKDLIDFKMRETKYKKFVFDDFVQGVKNRRTNWYKLEEYVVGEDLPDFDETANFVIENTKELLGI